MYLFLFISLCFSLALLFDSLILKCIILCVCSHFSTELLCLKIKNELEILRGRTHLLRIIGRNYGTEHKELLYLLVSVKEFL